MNPFDELDAVLPPGIAREYGPPPAPPIDYDEQYVLPQHSEKPLQRLHNHPLDDRLVFYEQPHVYTVDNVPTTLSVTGLAHQYEEVFDASKAIQLMKGSKKQAWPRREYVHDLVPLGVDWSPRQGALRVRDGLTIAVVQPHTMRGGSEVAHVRTMLDVARLPQVSGDEADDDVEEFAFSRAMSDTEIADAWARNGRIASHKGTEAHYGAECFFNGLPLRWWEPDMQVLLDFCKTTLVPRGIVAAHTEREIVCLDADLAGSIDLIVWDARNGVHHIIDHKRSDKLQGSLRGFRKMAAPFKHLDDCKGAAYALQTSIYQYILERDYGMTIGDRVLLSLHADRPFVTSVPYLRAEVEFLIETRIALVRARRAVAAARPDVFRCALSGAPVVDAVRSSDGRVVMEKMALVKGMTDVVPDEATRVAFETAVEDELTRRPPVEFAGGTSWRRQMPETGLRPFSDH